MKPFDIQTDVTLECPRCRAYKTVRRPPGLPAEVRLIEIICPDCDDGDFHDETWFSAPGVVVSQDTIQLPPDEPGKRAEAGVRLGGGSPGRPSPLAAAMENGNG